MLSCTVEKVQGTYKIYLIFGPLGQPTVGFWSRPSKMLSLFLGSLKLSVSASSALEQARSGLGT
jgi:hypothetical protein